MTPADLFAALAAIPRLPGAACVGRHELFDSVEPDDIATALAICNACPARRRCADWVDSLLPKQCPSGVVAGRVYVPTAPDHTRRHKATVA